jgi:microcystin-dependent protein
MTEYQVNFTDFVNKGSIIVDDGTSNSTDTSLVFPGRNFANYGKIVNENFLHLLENFANNTAPINPVEGQLWYNNTDGIDQLQIYDGTQWVSAGGLKKANSEPEASGSILGDLWVDTANKQLYIYSGSGYILVGPDFSEGAATGARFVNVVSTTNVENPVIINYVNNIPVSIISNTEFTPKLSISGFSTIRIGVNLRSNAKYYGTAEKAETLLVSGTPTDGALFARLNASNVFDRSIRINNNGGLIIGENQTLALSIAGSIAEIRNIANDGSIDFKVNSGGTSLTAMRIFNNTKITIGSNKIPTEALDVVGNIKTSGTVTILNSDTIATALSVSGSTTISENLSVTGTITVGDNLITDDILPSTNITKNIGTNALKYNNIYANSVYGSFIGNVTGNVTGTTTIAGKLSSPTTFTMTGDVIASSFAFDGQIGGSTKTFTTTLNSTFLTDKTQVTTVEINDEVLINRPGTGLRKIEQEDLVSKIPNTAQGPVIPVGSIMPYAGTTAPTGWFICDGTERSTPIYAALQAVIGTNFGAGTATTFKLPDFRGRTLLGWLYDASGTLPAPTGPYVSSITANTVGLTGGDESSLITDSQLPQHTHSLQSDAGTQFYATTNSIVTEPGTASISIVGGDPGTGFTRTAGITGYSTQDEFSTVPPFSTVNFIIYHGVF